MTERANTPADTTEAEASSVAARAFTGAELAALTDRRLDLVDASLREECEDDDDLGAMLDAMRADNDALSVALRRASPELGTLDSDDLSFLVSNAMSKVGMPNANGVTTSNQFALPTLSKFILPIAMATAQPATMPSSTEMLATKPLLYLTSSRMNTSTAPAMAMLSSAP